MEKRETANSHEAIPIHDPDSPYLGECGQTRFASVHVLSPGGALSSVSLCRALNVQTHPGLRERALSGTLHRLADGRTLALAFVYHDPEARKFALVVPGVVAHTELAERSRVLSELAQDTQHPIPRYVKSATVVIGAVGLEQYLRQPSAAEPDVPDEVGDTLLPDESELTSVEEGLPHADGAQAARAQGLLERERALTEQERSLVRMADGLSAREAELERQRQQLATAQQALEQREHALSGWYNAELSTSGAPEPQLSAAVGAHEPHIAGRSHPPPLPGYRTHRSGPPPLPMRTLPPLAAAQREIGLRVSALHAPPPLPPHNNVAPIGGRTHEPEVAPPAYFAGQRVGLLSLRLVADELWLFAHVDDSDLAQLRHGAELMLQLIEVEGYPVCLLSLVAAVNGAGPIAGTTPLRVALDGHADADLRVLEHLSRSYRARVALYVRRRYAETTTVAALREGVAQAICERLAQLSESTGKGERPAISATDAMLRVQHAPPPLSNDDLPFGPARREASTTASVHASVAQLSAWLTPEKLDEATFLHCVPRNVIDATLRRVLRAAVAFGIALPDELLSRAIEQRVAKDEPSLLRAQLQAFRQRVEQGANDLSGAATRKNWERLLDQAAARGVELDSAQRVLASGPDADGERARPLKDSSNSELVEQLDSATTRLAVIEELCLRGQTSAAASVLSAMTKLPREELPAAMAHVLLLGESAADALMDALSLPESPVRQLAALALGKLRSKRALGPLLALLQADESGIQDEVARAIGEYGAAAVSALAEAVPGAARSERLVVALAHVANHGAVASVEKLENASDASVSQAARKAMSTRSRIEWEDLAVRQQRTLEEAAPTLLLSQAFYAAAAKVAI